MKNFKRRVIDSGSSQNPFLAMAEAGISPREIKEFVIGTLMSYFDNLEIVEELAIDVLLPEVINIFKVKADPRMAASLDHVLKLYRQAKLVNPEASLQVCAESENDISNGLTHYWSCMYLEQEKAALSIHEFSFECFRLIGTLIEACIQPFLRDLLRQTRIVHQKTSSLPPTLKLGSLVGELFDTLGCTDLLAPPPWGIRLNQWRNMAQHHRTRIDGNAIIGTYGEHPNEREVILSRDDLMQVLRSIAAIFNVIKLARTIFFIDNIHQLKPLLGKITLREDARLLSLVTGISSQGFSVSNIQLSDTEAILEIVDLQELSEQRVVHAHQLLLPLWGSTQSANLIVHYSNQSGSYVAEFSTTGNACSQLNREEITLDEYLNQVSFTLLS